MVETFDTAVFVPSRGLYLFADDVVWRYGDGGRVPDPDYPKAITAAFPGAFARRLDAALVDPDGVLHFFRGDQHIRYDVAAQRPELGYPRRYHVDWPGVFDRRPIDAAVVWAPDVVYVFSGDQYVSFSPSRARVRPGFPKPIAGNWPGLDGGPVRAALVLPGGKRVLIGPKRAVAYERDGQPSQQELELPLSAGAATAPGRGLPALRSRRFRESLARADLEAVVEGRLRLGRRGDPEKPAPIRSTGPVVREVQAALIELGYRLGRGADGCYGNETHRAVLAYKRRHDIRTASGYLDGIVGPKTIRHIDAALPLPPCPAPRLPSTALAEADPLRGESQIPAPTSTPPAVAPSPAPVPVALFPIAVSPVLAADNKLQAALDGAVTAVETRRRLTPGSFPMPVAIAELTESRPFPFAGYREDELDLIASEAKVAVMFAAYALRDVARRFATDRGITAPADLFATLAKEVTPLVRYVVPRIASSSDITDAHRDGSYGAALEAIANRAGPVTVRFRSSFRNAIEQMIVPSNDFAAGTCVHAVGYAYLNAVLAACGLFDTTNDRGLWVGTDYHGGDPPFTGTRWPSVRVPVANDDPSGPAGTTRKMVELVSLIAAKLIIDPGTCEEMLGHLHRAAVPPTQVDRVLASEPGILRTAAFTHNKIGVDPLTAAPNRGIDVYYEVSILDGPVASGRRYVVAWQNFIDRHGMADKGVPAAFADIAGIIRDTITEYERPARSPEAGEGESWAAAEGLHEEEGPAPRGERWVTETYEPGRADLHLCDSDVRVAQTISRRQ
jgi:peptidoglycan hydrolase-like protein with peptidoglycan-binding domain